MSYWMTIQKLRKWCSFWIQKFQKYCDFWIQKSWKGTKIFLNPDIVEMLRFLDPETAEILRFLDPEIVKIFKKILVTWTMEKVFSTVFLPDLLLLLLSTRNEQPPCWLNTGLEIIALYYRVQKLNWDIQWIFYIRNLK